MNCRYYNEELKRCEMRTFYATSVYRPNENELKKFCKSDGFPKCKRLKTHLRELGHMSAKDMELLAHPEHLPRPILVDRARQALRALSPREEYQPNFVFSIDKLLLGSLLSNYREDFKVSLGIEFMYFGDMGQCVKTDVQYRYTTYNLTDHPIQFPIPLRVYTHSFVEDGLPIQDHITLREVSCKVKGNSWRNLIKENELDQVPVTSIHETKVGLDLGTKATQIIPPNSSVTVNARLTYVNRMQDNHIHRMLTLTRNVRLEIKYDENDLFIDVDGFCLPKKQTLAKGHEYAWDGWFLPHHGILVDWIPMFLLERAKVLAKKRMSDTD